MNISEGDGPTASFRRSTPFWRRGAPPKNIDLAMFSGDHLEIHVVSKHFHLWNEEVHTDPSASQVCSALTDLQRGLPGVRSAGPLSPTLRRRIGALYLIILLMVLKNQDSYY